jgi:hypothetical protein
MSAALRYMGPFLLAALACASCNVLLPADWGRSGKPCRDDSDCNKGYECEQNRAKSNYCVPTKRPSCTSDTECYNELDLASAYCGTSNVCEPWDSVHGFGDECGTNSDCDEANGLTCICFLNDENCFCSPGDCDTTNDCAGETGSAVCMQTGFPTHALACGRPGFTGGVGVSCTDNGDCESGTECVWFEAVAKNFCAEQECEANGDCGWQFECYNGACAFRDWLGFNKECTIDADCPGPYPKCPNGSCTRLCQDEDDCPAATVCQSQSGFCEYQS